MPMGKNKEGTSQSYPVLRPLPQNAKCQSECKGKFCHFFVMKHFGHAQVGNKQKALKPIFGCL